MRAQVSSATGNFQVVFQQQKMNVARRDKQIRSHVSEESERG